MTNSPILVRTKDHDLHNPLAAMRQVAAGRCLIDPALAEAMTFHVGKAQTGSSHDHPADREFEIPGLLADGEMVNDIAAALAISIKTASTHKARLMEKMDFASNADLVRFAMPHRMVE